MTDTLIGEPRPDIHAALIEAAATGRQATVRALRPPAEIVTDSASWAGARPRLSVLIPFHGDDPRPLLSQLAKQAAPLGRSVEMVVLNDGDPDAAHGAAVARRVGALTCPARLIQLRSNEGRALGRNRLARHARGRHLLFLDSDMGLPDGDFLSRWLAAATAETAVAFGGFTVDPSGSAATDLHRALSQRSDCLPAARRRRHPEKYVFTSNLLVRRDVFDAERFDEDFRGWGWEDVEWGMRVARRWPVDQLDNPAVHLGLENAGALARKFEQSAANFARIAAAHPEMMSRLPSFRVARLIKQARLAPPLRPLLKAALLAPALPLGLRSLAARMYRAALYAPVL